MKKILMILSTIITAFTLIACQNQTYDVNLEIEVFQPNYKSFSMVIRWDDKNNDLVEGSVYLTASYEDKVIARNDNLKSGEKFELTGLKAGTTYTIEVKGTKNKSIVLLHQSEKQTLSEGGSETNPYLISNKEDLLEIYQTMHQTEETSEHSDIEYRKEILLNTYYKLENDLDMENEVLTSSLFNNKEFKGSFDGNNKTIKNLEIENTTKGEVSLFGRINGTIKNLKLDNIYINAGKNTYAGTSYVAILAHNTYAQTQIEDITITNSQLEYKHYSTVGTLFLGAVAGSARGLYKNIEMDHVSIEVEITRNLSTAHIGGVIGRYVDETNQKINRIQKIHVTNNTIDVNFSHIEEKDKNRSLSVGGIIGTLSIGGTQSNLFYQGRINLNQNKYENKLNETDSQTNSEVIVGGLVGRSSSQITQGYSDASIQISNTSQTDTKQALKGIKTVKAGLLAGSNQYVLDHAVSKGKIDVLTDSLEENIFIGYTEKPRDINNYARYQEVIFILNEVTLEDEANLLTLYETKALLISFLEGSKVNQEWLIDKL